MTKPVELRQRAADDIEAAVDYYRQASGQAVALRFIDAVDRVVGQLGRRPLLGSLRFSYEVGVPELRSWPLAVFPYLVFYVDRGEYVDVWRVLHTRRDVPAALATGEGPSEGSDNDV